MFIGAKNSGKTYGLVKMIKNSKDLPIKDSKGNILQISTILFSPTGKSEANPIYTTLKSFDFENDVVEDYTGNKLTSKSSEVEKDKEDKEDFNKHVKAYKKIEKNDKIKLIDSENLVLLYEYDFEHFNNIPQPKYKHPPIVFNIGRFNR
jgi:hypothetical protein